MVRDTIVDIQDVHYYRVVVVTWASGWKDHVPFGDMNPYIRSSRWEWVGRECWRVAVYNCGWEFWLLACYSICLFCSRLGKLP